MADICDNILDVWHDGDAASDLDEFIASVRGHNDAGLATDLSLARLSPDETDDETARVIWRTTHWGCKREPAVEGIERVDGGIRYRFATPDSGPTYWCERASALFPSLHFRLISITRETETAGVLHFKRGVLIGGENASRSTVPPGLSWEEWVGSVFARVSASAIAPPR